MPHAKKLHDQFGAQGLHVLLVESQAHKREETLAFTLQAFPGHGAQGVLGADSPFSVEGAGLPKTALVGVDGKVAWISDKGGSLEKILEDQLSRLHQVNGELDKSLKSVTKDLNTRALGKAVTTARAAAAKAADGSKAKADAEALVAHLEKSVERRMAMAERLLKAGRAAKARAALVNLQKQVAGDKDWTQKVTDEIGSIDQDHKDDLAADKLVMAAEDLMRDKKGRQAGVDKLAEVTKKFSGAKVAKLAEQLSKAAQDKSVMR